jgi:hypothetical protein
MVLTAGSHPVIRIDLDTKIVERGVELTLAILLFVDATEVPGGILGRERRVLGRLLAIALPLSLIIAWLVGATAKHSPAVEALENAVPAILIAVGVGGAIGLTGAVTLGWSWRRNWTEAVRAAPRGARAPGSPSSLTAQVMIITVLLSVILHGVTAGPIAAAFARRAAVGRQEEKGEPAAAISRASAGNRAGQHTASPSRRGRTRRPPRRHQLSRRPGSDRPRVASRLRNPRAEKRVIGFCLSVTGAAGLLVEALRAPAPSASRWLRLCC